MNDKIVYLFLLNMWIMKRIDEAYLSEQVVKGRINEGEKAVILVASQVV
ncbi:hypothetical protein [Lysinibacillus sp. FJAT-14745]|nr:hypothetical protein [Lysinibacillus sp. FJAT-14745]